MSAPSDDFIVHISDIRRTGHCCKGLRRWFEANSLNFPDFLKNGIPASRLLATKDGLAVTVVGQIKAQRTHG